MPVACCPHFPFAPSSIRPFALHGLPACCLLPAFSFRPFALSPFRPLTVVFSTVYEFVGWMRKIQEIKKVPLILFLYFCKTK
jgi:hypothetical protein